MKGLILTLAMLASSSAWAAMDASAQFVHNLFTRGKQIMELGDEQARVQQMCSLLKTNLGSNHIAGIWLGRYARLDRDVAGVRNFRAMIPSILISKALGEGGGSMSGDFRVEDRSEDRGGGVLAVSIVVSSNGRAYRGKVIVNKAGNTFKAIDAEYMGYSAVQYMAEEYQEFLNDEFNKDRDSSLPVTALVNHLKSDPDFVDCR